LKPFSQIRKKKQVVVPLTPKGRIRKYNFRILSINRSITNHSYSPLGVGGHNFIFMNIQVLGTGCQKCKSLEKATREVVAQNNIDATITKVEDIVEIMKFNVMTTPALVIDGKVVVKGRVPSSDELKQLLIKQ